AYVAASPPAGTSGFGPGWGLAGLDQLIADGSGALWISGATGGTRYFALTGGVYVSPANDFGTLVKNGNNTFTYTAPDQTKINFDTSGNLVSVVDSDGQTQTVAYSAGKVASITEAN